MTEKDYEMVRTAFDNYYGLYKNSLKDIDRKYGHCLKVSELMKELAKRLGLSKEDIVLATIIGLLHDLGRFEQLKQTASFKDKAFDHAEYAVTYLFELGHIKEFLNTREYDAIIMNAIKYHNKYVIPDDLDERTKLFCNMIRDMDKTDIFYQCAVCYNYVYDGDVTKEVQEEFDKGICVHLDKMKTKSDEVLQAMALLTDYNFDESFDILVETDNFGLWASSIDVSKDQEENFRKLINKCNAKIERGV